MWRECAPASVPTARASANDIEYIGCGVRKVDNGAGGAIANGFCQASNAAGIAVYCATQNAELLDVIENVADCSFITFAWNADGQCRTIGISTQSMYIP